MTDTPTPEAIVKAALERAADCCEVGPSDEWSGETREGYLFGAGDCQIYIRTLASDQAEVAQIIQNAGGQTDPYLYAVGYDVGFEDGFKEAQGRVKELEATLRKLEYWFDTDQEILDVMGNNEKADHMRKLKMIRDVLKGGKDE